MVNLAETSRDPARLILLALAPLVFVLHVVEEAPGFVAWVNALMDPDITQATFLRVNAGCLVVTVMLAVALAATRAPAVAIATLGWLAFLMAGNAVLHLGATALTASYCPGAITSALLYLPYFGAFAAAVRRQYRVGWPAILLTSALGAAPMLVHGYLIVFEGSRLW